MPRKDVLLALLLPLLWGIGFTFAKPAVGHFPPIFMLSLVYLAAAVAHYRPWRPLQTPWWAMFVIAALAIAVQNALIFTGLKGVPAATAGLVVQSQVPMAVIAAAIFGSERLNYLRAIGMLVAFAGLVVVAGAPEAIGSLGALLLIIAGALLWAIGQVLTRVIGRDEGRQMAGALCLWAAPQSFLLSLPLESGQWASLTSASLDSWLALGALTLFGYVFAYGVWYALLLRHRVDQVTPFTLLMPVVGVFLSWLVLGEDISALTLVGGILVLLGIAVVVSAPSGPAPLSTPAQTR